MQEVITLTTMLTAAGSGVLVPFVNKLLGPSADELATMIAERARIYRLQNTFNVFRKAQKMTSDAGFEPQQVNLKTLLPLMEGASLEEDSSLADKWAALLANAANPANSIAIKPAYADILKQLTSQEAQLLDKVFASIQALHPSATGVDIASTALSADEYWGVLAVNTVINLGGLRFEYAHDDPNKIRAFNALADNLLRQRLLIAANKSELQLQGKGNGLSQGMSRLAHSKPEMSRTYLSALGFDFMHACRPPAKEMNA